MWCCYSSLRGIQSHSSKCGSQHTTVQPLTCSRSNRRRPKECLVVEEQRKTAKRVRLGKERVGSERIARVARTKLGENEMREAVGEEAGEPEGGSRGQEGGQ